MANEVKIDDTTKTNIVNTLLGIAKKAGLAIVFILMIVAGIVLMVFNHWFNIPFPWYLVIGCIILILGFIGFITWLIIKMVLQYKLKVREVK